MSQLKVNSIVDASGGSNAVLYGPASPAGSMGFRNRIINGAMQIDQRNAGASVTQTTSPLFPVDRFQIFGSVTSKFTAQQNAGSVTPPTGFTNYLGITSSAATTPGASDIYFLRHNIEGYNTSDLAWGTAGAKTVTVSFWARSSLTGTFGCALMNDATDRNYPFTYSISAANTWEYKTVTITGDASGTWLTTTSTGIRLYFYMGAGSSRTGTANAWATVSGATAPSGLTNLIATSGATLYITGVQLEVGSVATEFERRPYGTELALCQRYFQTYAEAYYNAVRTNFVNGSANDSGSPYTSMILYPVPMRATPSATLGNQSASINAADSSRARIVYNSSRSPGQSELIITTLALSAEL
jgi:hypothetical protein